MMKHSNLMHSITKTGMLPECTFFLMCWTACNNKNTFHQLHCQRIGLLALQDISVVTSGCYL